MKLCPKCDQPVAEEITTCPSCGSSIVAGRKYIDDYRIVDIVHEGHASFLCRAIRERTQELVMIRLFTDQAGVDQEVAKRLEHELEELKKLSPDDFVRHYAIRLSSDGLWYRTSEWINSKSWGSLLASGRLTSLSTCLDLFHRLAKILAELHKRGHIIPHLILNDIIVVKDEPEQLRVKIDYKLSRFFDPKLDKPGPVLKKLLESHPDIVNQRPFDYKTDIWSLGKIFVELLTADLDLENFLGKIDDLDLPGELSVLLKVMLADDPDIRPGSMQEVAESLARIKQAYLGQTHSESVGTQSAPARTMIHLSKMVRLLAVAVILLGIVGGIAWFQLGQRPEDNSAIMEEYANRYAPALAFLVTEYWLEVDMIRYYSRHAEGTAFLADEEGYLLTGRHVVCPWLEDATLFAAAEQLRLRNLQPQFGYRIFLWFEGEKAFNRGARMIERPDLSDVFIIDTAFSTDEFPYLVIAGVAKPPQQTAQLMASPLKDDYAVLKIDYVPEGLKPLPLDQTMDPQSIPKLSPVIALGFPLGRQTQASTVNVSVTRGHVRRTFENLIQVDASIYGGNSGGPIIDSRGQVIGIVAGVALDRYSGATPMWDLGMILPIGNAVHLVEELKSGQVKWNGLIDFSVEKTLEEIKEAALDDRWGEAMTKAEDGLDRSMQPSLVTAAAMMHFCLADYSQAKKRFEQALSIDREDNQARLMIYLSDWMTGTDPFSPQGRYLLDLDWQSRAEFQSYLVQAVAGLVDEESALRGWYDPNEKSWLRYVVALLVERRGNLERAEELLKESILTSGVDGWLSFLARARLSHLHRKKRILLQTEEDWEKYNLELETFEKQVANVREEKKKMLEQLKPFISGMGGGATKLEQRLALLEKMYDLIPENRYLLIGLAYSSAARNNWKRALGYIDTFLETSGRENVRRLGIELFKAVILFKSGKKDEAREYLEEYQKRIRVPWFFAVSDFFLGRETEASLRVMAGSSPEKLLTAFTYLGFWEEGRGENEKALKYYKEALESFLDDWAEYSFARERIKSLKTTHEPDN